MTKKKDPKKQPHKERRRFPRTDFKASLECQHFFDAEISDIYMVESQNISQAGILIFAPFSVPLGATISFQVEREKLLNKIQTQKLQSYIEIDLGHKAFVKLCGKVVRIEDYKPGVYKVAVHLINK